MRGWVVASFPFTHLPGVSPILPKPPFHLLFHFLSLKIPRSFAHLPMRCSWGVGPPSTTPSPLLCLVRGPRASCRVPSKICAPSTPSQRACSQVICPLLEKAPCEAFLTFRPTSAQTWPRARDNHFLAGCLPSWAPWAQTGWRLNTWPEDTGMQVLTHGQGQQRLSPNPGTR